MGDNIIVGRDPWGGRSCAVFDDHTGPSSYVVGGESLGQSVYGGPNVLGLSGWLKVLGGLTDSGNYSVSPYFKSSGNQQKVWLRWNYANPSGLGSPTSPGVPLSLGTLSSAATQSTYTTGGLVTVVGANTLKAGQFIVLSNGGSGAGIFLDGVMVQVASATATGYTFNFGQGVALDYTIASDTLKYQVVQSGSGNQLQALALSAPITGVLATANLLTITQANSLVPGQFVYLNGPFKTASVYALGAVVQVASATATGWTANWQGTIIAQTSGEVAVASLLVTNGNAPIASYPYSASNVAIVTNVTGVASGATAAGLVTLVAAQVYQAGMLVVAQGIGTATALDGTIGTVISTNLAQTTFKINGWNAVAQSATADTGYAAVLVTGAPATNEVTAGTNLSGETVRLLAIGG